MKKLSNKNKRVLNKLLGKQMCPGCDEYLREYGIKLIETVVKVIYSVSLDQLGDLQYEQDDIKSGSGDNEWSCASCGHILDLSEEEVIRILKDKTKSL